MKVLIIGDFHGKLSKKLEKKIRKISPDLILSPGDFCGDETLKRFFFKKIYAKDDNEISLEDMITYNDLEIVSFKAGVYLVKRLKRLQIPFFSIRGNWDPSPFGHDISSEFDKKYFQKMKDFEKLETEKFSFVDMKFVEFDSFVLVGGASSTSPQKLNKGSLNNLVKKNNRSKKKAEADLKRLRNNWDKRQKLYENNFARAVEIRKKTGKRIVFLTHNCPYGTSIDKIKKGPVEGKHYGSYQERLVIKRYKPDLIFCGHIHENFGKDKIDKSVIYNVGSALDGKFMVMEI